LTFMPLEEIEALVCHKDERINAAKERLAFEITKIVHGEEDAVLAQTQARAAFSGDSSAMPAETIPAGVDSVVDIMVALKVAASKGEAKRLIQGGGVSIDDAKVTAFDAKVPAEKLASGFVLHKGKKVHIKVSVE
ncbi:MAG: tyrosine--tRNA ligase, partial [Clostridia bacterium]|nr:tyrosine--tRNA ligase [Clostridia bacterium]